MGTEFQLGKRQCSGHDGGDGHTAVCLYLMSLSCAFKNG